MLYQLHLLVLNMVLLRKCPVMPVAQSSLVTRARYPRSISHVGSICLSSFCSWDVIAAGPLLVGLAPNVTG